MASSDPADVDAINAEASVLMKRGIRIMEESQPDVREALACFERALAMRSQLPYETEPLLRYSFAACWLNRGDALNRLGESAAALDSYDEGIDLLRALPFEDDPRFPRRLAIACQNRGLILQTRGEVDEAAAAFTDARTTLEEPYSRLIHDRASLLAAVWMNLANAHASQATAESGILARDAALEAIALVTESEATLQEAADIGLRARHVLCRLLAEHLSSVEPGDATVRAAVDEATDAVDDGLDLVRRWERRGATRFRAIASDLFRFGVRVYGAYQPQFVEEFLADNIDPAQSSVDYVNSPEIRFAVEEARAMTAARARGES